MQKNAYSVQMNYDVPESEKKIAEMAKQHFEEVIVACEDLADYLLKIYNPFYKLQNPDMKLIQKYSKTFIDYSKEVNNKFEDILTATKESIKSMEEFRADTSTEEMMDSFMGAIRELRKYIDIFMSIFQNLNNQDFRNNLISTIDSTKRQLNQIKQLIMDRILEHIENNILARNWSESISDDQDIKQEEKVPLVVELYRKRQQALQGK
jgi:dGTP triphosphohydrolase